MVTKEGRGHGVSRERVTTLEKKSKRWGLELNTWSAMGAEYARDENGAPRMRGGIDADSRSRFRLLRGFIRQCNNNKK